MRRCLATATLVMAALLQALIPVQFRSPLPVAQAADVWPVQVGGDIASESIEPTAFFPNPLIIHAGDSVNFSFAGNHTVTFLGKQQPPDLIDAGPGPGEAMAGPAYFPIGPIAADNSVSYDGSALISSGVPNGPGSPPFRVTFPKTGTYSYVCLLHPGMSGTIQVLSAGASLPETPAQAVTRGRATLATFVSDLRNAEQTPRDAATPLPGGETVHTVAAGISVPGEASALRFLPGNVTVSQGDAVVFTVTDPSEIHTVTFLSGAPVPAETETRSQANGAPLLVFPASVASPVGGNDYTGQGIINSGLLGPGDSFVLTIDAPPGTYEYRCLIHSGAVAQANGSPPMIGTITVQP